MPETAARVRDLIRLFGALAALAALPCLLSAAPADAAPTRHSAAGIRLGEQGVAGWFVMTIGDLDGNDDLDPSANRRGDLLAFPSFRESTARPTRGVRLARIGLFDLLCVRRE